MVFQTYKIFKATDCSAKCGVFPPGLVSKVENIIPWQQKRISALLHLLLSLDALRRNHVAWNVILCLFSLAVVLINIFLCSPQMDQGCLWKAKTNSRSGFLLLDIIICGKWNYSSPCSDLCRNTEKLLKAPLSLLRLGWGALFWHSHQQVYNEKSSEGLKNIHSVHQNISLCFFNPFKSAFLGLHFKWETGSSAVRTLCCHIMHGVVQHSSPKSLSIHHLFPSRNLFLFFFFSSFLGCLWLLFIFLVSWLQGTFLLAGLRRFTNKCRGTFLMRLRRQPGPRGQVKFCVTQLCSIREQHFSQLLHQQAPSSSGDQSERN